MSLEVLSGMEKASYISFSNRSEMTRSQYDDRDLQRVGNTAAMDSSVRAVRTELLGAKSPSRQCNTT